MEDEYRLRGSIQAPAVWMEPTRHFISVMESDWYRTIVALTSSVFWSTVSFFAEEDFTPALAPVTTGCVTSPQGLGSDSIPVEVTLFDEKTYLADSMQFHLEYLLRLAPRGVFYIMPSFRGEPPSNRHLNQFFHVEAEFRGSLDEVMWLVERYLVHCVRNILVKCNDLVASMAGSTAHLERLIDARNGIPRVPFENAKAILGSNASYYVRFDEQEIGLTDEGEQELIRRYAGPVWITHFPSEGVPFYQATDVECGRSLCADLLMGAGETVGVGERHSSYEDTFAALTSHNVDPSSYEWYLEMKLRYPIKTSGFGMGLERFLLWVLKHQDIRDLPLFLRMRGVPSGF